MVEGETGFLWFCMKDKWQLCRSRLPWRHRPWLWSSTSQTRLSHPHCPVQSCWPHTRKCSCPWHTKLSTRKFPLNWIPEPHMRYRSRLRSFSFWLAPIPESHEFIEVAHIGPYYGAENDCRNFRSNRMDSFWENRKMAIFLAFLG